MALTFRLASVADADLCNDFHGRLARRLRTKEQWIWEFGAREGAPEVLYALALDGDSLVGSTAFIPIPMRGPTGTIMTGKGEDSLIAPRYWGKDLLRPLYELLTERAERSGVSLFWGFNSRRPVFEKLGYHYLAGNEASVLMRPISWRALRRLATLDRHGRPRAASRQSWRHRLAANGMIAAAATTLVDVQAIYGRTSSYFGNRSVEIVSLATVPESIRSLVESFVTRAQSITVDRTPAFLRWRLQENPYMRSSLLGAFANGELIGFAGYAISPRRFGTITDLIVSAPGHSALENAAIFRLLDVAGKAMQQAGADFIRITLMNHHPQNEALRVTARKLGYQHMPVAMGACIMPIGGYKMPEPYMQADRWHFTDINSEGTDA